MKKLIVLATASSLLFASYAKVNGEDITKSDIVEVIKNPNIDFNKLPDSAKKQVINAAINSKLLSQKAISDGIENDKEFQMILKNLKESLARDIWIKRLAQKIVITDKEINDFYNQNKSKFIQPEMFKARHILVKTKQEAVNIINKLNNADNKLSTFISLAKKYSIGPTGANGGSLGWFDSKTMVPEFTKAVKNLKTNSYTKEPIKTQFGWHVIYLEAKKEPKNIPLNKVKKQIVNYLKQQKLQQEVSKILQELRQKAKIEIY